MSMSTTTTPQSSPPSSSSFDVLLSYQGQSIPLRNVVTTQTTVRELHQLVLRETSSLQSNDNDDDKKYVKILHKGKVLVDDCHNYDDNNHNNNEDAIIAFPTIPKKTPAKLLVVASSSSSIRALRSKRSDPTVRGFHDRDDKHRNNTKRNNHSTSSVWGQHVSPQQDSNYKFCRFQACTWQSFGERADDVHTPHSYRALNLLEKLALDPGIVYIMKERQLLVGTLGEMDPIDDRVKRKHETATKGLCLLGYNTNAGTRIDLKLRPDSLHGFLPYSQIVATLLHELSHNWVGPHNLLFWTNYGQMRVEYYHVHYVQLRMELVKGQTTARIANLPSSLLSTTGGSGGSSGDGIAELVLSELRRDMAQHGLTPDDTIAPAIVERCRELQSQQAAGGGGGGGSSLGPQALGGRGARAATMDPRQMALVAAEERRARNNDAAAAKEEEEENSKKESKDDK